MRILQRELQRIRIFGGFHRKKAFTLIEVIISMLLVTLLGSFIVRLYLHAIEEYSKTIEETREACYINEAFRYIEQECRWDTKSLDIQDNVLILERFSLNNPTRQPVDSIKLEGTNIVIKYKAYGLDQGTNVIVRKIRNFLIDRKSNLFFINITSESGRRYERCYGMANLK